MIRRSPISNCASATLLLPESSSLGCYTTLPGPPPVLRAVGLRRGWRTRLALPHGRRSCCGGVREASLPGGWLLEQRLTITQQKGYLVLVHRQPDSFLWISISLGFFFPASDFTFAYHGFALGRFHPVAHTIGAKIWFSGSRGSLFLPAGDLGATALGDWLSCGSHRNNLT